MIKKIILKIRKNIFWRLLSIFHLLSIYSFFTEVSNDGYVLIKKDLNFPKVKIGSDFDIYTEDLSGLIDKIEKFYKSKKNYILTRNKINSENEHIDLFYKKRFIFKFDLYGLSYKSKIHNDKFIKKVIETSSIHNFRFIYRYKVRLPSSNMDLMVRIFEYYQYPKKLHHKNFIENINNKAYEETSRQIETYSKIKKSKLYMNVKHRIVH